ncbi:unnamed protein product [Musa acuminata subsp. malaccensis]|uniref:(wild Malaysian banana) hypothetical protein n=1 Tax=Musa acuminata subsp. malaccensis TaxID=214687 RepID=A0A804IMQ7_MUSAM|nr:unnamed protein product [Musa acuminata subsp. malaccensis]
MESPEASSISLPDQQSMFPWDSSTEEREKITNLADREPRRRRSPLRRPSLHSHGATAEARRRFHGRDVSSSPAIPEDSPSTYYEWLPEESHLVVRMAAMHVGGHDGGAPARTRTLQNGHGDAGVQRRFGRSYTPLFLAPGAVQRTTALEAEPDWSGSMRNDEDDALSRLRLALAPAPAPRYLEPTRSIPTGGVYPSQYVGQNRREFWMLPSRLQRTAVDANHLCLRELHRLSILSSSYGSLMTSGKCIYCMAKDKRECQKLLQLADADAPQLVDLLYHGVIDHVDELTVHPYGNNLMLKLLEVCSKEQTQRIIVELAADPNRGILDLFLDPNGNRVINTFLTSFPPEYNQIFFAAAAGYCYQLATHQHGCCILQSCIKYSTGELRAELLKQTAAYGHHLSMDAYGNYVVQCLIDLKDPSINTTLASQFRGNYVELSRHKSSSHVVEKCLKKFEEEHQAQIIYELASSPEFKQLLQDPYANYVIRSALELTKVSIRRRINL